MVCVLHVLVRVHIIHSTDLIIFWMLLSHRIYKKNVPFPQFHALVDIRAESFSNPKTIKYSYRLTTFLFLTRLHNRSAALEHALHKMSPLTHSWNANKISIYRLTMVSYIEAAKVALTKRGHSLWQRESCCSAEFWAMRNFCFYVQPSCSDGSAFRILNRFFSSHRYENESHS